VDTFTSFSVEQGAAPSSLNFWCQGNCVDGYIGQLFVGSGGDPGSRGIYLASQGWEGWYPPDISEIGIAGPIVDTETPVPDGPGNFSFFGLRPYPHVLEFWPGYVFRGGIANDQGMSMHEGIYASDSFYGTLKIYADTSASIPRGIGNFTGFGDPVAISSYGVDVVAQGFGSDNQAGIYKFGINEGSILVIVDQNTPRPGGAGSFVSFGLPAVRGEAVVFRAEDVNQNEGIYLVSNGELTMMVDENTLVPGGSGTFTAFGDPFYDGTTLAFLGEASAPPASYQLGIYRIVGDQLTVVADLNTPIPDGIGNFTGFGMGPNEGAVCRSEKGDGLVFVGVGANNQGGIYIMEQGVLRKLVDRDDRLDGKAPWLFDIRHGDTFRSTDTPAGPSSASLSFAVAFTDATEAIYRVSETLEGDIDANGCVDLDDLDYVRWAVRSRVSDSMYDVNGDGVVNIADARAVVVHFTNPGGEWCD
jgi:hypothetical protein